jgi:hypothetical protein
VNGSTENAVYPPTHHPFVMPKTNMDFIVYCLILFILGNRWRNNSDLFVHNLRRCNPKVNKRRDNAVSLFQFDIIPSVSSNIDRCCFGDFAFFAVDGWCLILNSSICPANPSLVFCSMVLTVLAQLVNNCMKLNHF